MTYISPYVFGAGHNKFGLGVGVELEDIVQLAESEVVSFLEENMLLFIPKDDFGLYVFNRVILAPILEYERPGLWVNGDSSENGT